MTERAPSTIRDVALRAGVSTATVSRVLAGVGHPRADTAAAVVRAADELGYRPSGVARSLRMRRTQTLGLIVSDIQTPFFPELVDAVAAASRCVQYSVILGTVAGGEVLEYLDLMVDRGIDGLILATGRIDERMWTRLVEMTTPVVVVNNEPGAMRIPVPVLVTDNTGATASAVAHLAGLGHRRIGYLAGPPDSTASAARLAGFRRGCRDAGLDLAACPEIDAGIDVESGARAFRQLVASDPSITAVVAYNDLLAIGALQATAEGGGSVPADMSVVGFDDIAAASWVSPKLTTVRQEKARLGELAVERLVGLIDGSRPSGEDEVMRLPGHLVIRESTGVPRTQERWQPR